MLSFPRFMATIPFILVGIRSGLASLDPKACVGIALIARILWEVVGIPYHQTY